jgi:hypothetical protein
MYGPNADTHINLGTSSTTGLSGQDRSYTTVGGGKQNTASGPTATVGGGWFNTASGWYTTVSGGEQNRASGYDSTVGGGLSNTASGSYATISGGEYSTASGSHSTVPGGYNNIAGGASSFAAGRRAKANHNGAFVWADSTDADFASTGNNQFLIRASGGVGIGTTNPSSKLHVDSGCITGSMCSDIRLKKNIMPLSSSDSILDRIMGLQAVTFEWKHRDDGKRQIGLIAQEVEDVFPEVVTTPDDGSCQKGLLTTGLDAVLVEAIKELRDQVEQLREQNEYLLQKLTALEVSK